MIKQLSLVTKISEKFRLSADQTSPDNIEPEEYKQYFPALTVLVRDFFLQATDAGGNSITPTEMLTKALTPKMGQSMALMQENHLKMTIQNAF